MEKAYRLRIAASCCQDERPRVDAATHVEDVLKALQLGRSEWPRDAKTCISPVQPAVAVGVQVRLLGEAVGDQELDARQLPLVYGCGKHAVADRRPLLEREGEAVGVPYDGRRRKSRLCRMGRHVQNFILHHQILRGCNRSSTDDIMYPME